MGWEIHSCNPRARSVILANMKPEDVKQDTGKKTLAEKLASMPPLQGASPFAGQPTLGDIAARRKRKREAEEKRGE